MKFNKRLVNVIAKKVGKDPDDLILSLWDFDEKKFSYLKNQSSVIKNDDLKVVKKLFLDLNSIDSSIMGSNIEKQERKELKREYNFKLIGDLVDQILYINREDILKIHGALVSDLHATGDPIFPAGIKNEHLLDSALFHPKTANFGVKKYPTAQTSGAALMYAISNNHPFHNGNKRTALVALLVFLDRHNIFLTCNEDDLFKLSIDVASHKFSGMDKSDNDKEIFELAFWIAENSKIMRKDEHPITLKKLKKILKSFNCEVYENGKVVRVILKPIILGYTYSKELKSRIPSNGDISEGTELSIKTVKNIRRELCLDVENGISSDDFYRAINDSTELSNEFIVKYKNLLTRLSKR